LPRGSPIYNFPFSIKGLAMPIYAYRCAACGHAKDVLRKISDPPLTDCPACGVAAFSKQLTAAGFQLKGSGWYVTDFKGGGKSGPAKPADGGGSGSDSGSGTGGDSGGAAGDSGGGAGGSGSGDGKPAADSSAAPAGCGTSCACH
jgi:putative FmdB family regulatory protein